MPNSGANQRVGRPRRRAVIASAWRIWPGSTRKHSIRLAMITAITTSGMVRMIEPMTSVISSSGRNAAIVVSAAQNTGVAMRRAPASAASVLS